MSLEGGRIDRFTGDSVNRRFRTIDREFAIANVPQIILLLKRRKLTITRSFSVENPTVIYLEYMNHPGNKWIILESDFNKILGVSTKIDTRLFPNESDDSILGRILAYVMVEWL